MLVRICKIVLLCSDADASFLKNVWLINEITSCMNRPSWSKTFRSVLFLEPLSLL